MKIIEAMKQIKINERKINQNREEITRYSSAINTEKPLFANENQQREAVKELLQANTDLVKRNMKLKKAIEKTNLEVKVTIEGTEWSLSEFLMLNRKYAKMMMDTYAAQNDSAGEMRLRTVGSMKDSEGKTPHVVRFYDEKKKNEGRKEWMDLADSITTRLEVINATTELIGLEE